MTAEILAFSLLQILSRPEDGPPVVLRDGELVRGDLRFPLTGSAPALAKIAYLARRVGLENVPLERLAEAWSALLAGEHPRTPRELLAAVRRAEIRDAEEDEIQWRWRASVEPLLRQIPATAGAVEAFGPQTPPEDLALRLELRPLLETWPRRLLHDPVWATVEAPLPGMNPLPLDEAWVDLQVMDPGDWPVLAGLESLRSLLDQRYEERRWQSEPLALVLEKLNGVAAFIGPPGSGKTTLLKWIARRLIQEPDSRYLLPLFVPLRRYVLWSRNGGETGLLRFALQECGVQRPEQRALWIQILNEMAGTWRERVLVLLDGWDEVPVEEREPLLQELRDVAYGFSILVTSRPAAFPSRLTASHVYEVSDLAPDSIDALIRRWFRSVGEPERAEPLLHHLDQHPDLRRLARNPFLLTLLCGISREAHRREGLDLPSTRAELYEQTLRFIYAHHAERYPEAPAGADQQRQIERLALWLLDEAPGAPRFVFGHRDVIDSGGDPDLLPRVLKPSRLLSQLGPDDETHHFLHATFQEYLAAGALEREPSDQAILRLRGHVHEATWQEVFHFLAAKPGPLREAFWQEVSALASRPDRFGLVLARLARWVAAAGAQDGGTALLRRDLRELLWPFVERITASRIWVEAYAELDASGFVRRVDEAIQKADPRLRARLQRALTRVRNPTASQSLVEQILSDDPHKAAVAATQLRLRINSAGLDRLREAVGDSRRSVTMRQQAIQALGYSRDPTSVPLLIRIAETESNLAGEVTCALGRIGGRDATIGLVAMLERPDSGLQYSVVRALGDMRDALARDALLDEIARRPADDPLIVPILNALAEIPIHRGAELIVNLLASETPEVRRAAAWALAEGNGPGVFEGLVTAASDPDEEVRCAALEVFQNRARPDDAGWLGKFIQDSSRSSDERGFALRALLVAAGRYAGSQEGQWLPGIAVEQILLALRDPEGDLALEAVAYAHHAGSSVGPRLVELCLDDEASPSVRELACAALGKMEYRGAVDVLLGLVRAAPEGDDDEDQPLESGRQRMARAAAEALARIDAGLLLREPGSTAFYALARFAVETGCLVYDDRVIGPDGREWARSPLSPLPISPQPSRRSGMPRNDVSAVDLDIKVSVRTIDGSRVLHYTLSSPSGAAPLTHREVYTAPFASSFDTYRDRVIHRLEQLQERLDPYGSRLRNIEVEPELRKLGHELYRQLFPSEMKWMYRQWRERVRTIQISSAEWWIPWELIRPYDHEIQPVVDDDFLGARYQITRWLIGGSAPAPAIRVLRMACVEAGQSGGPRLPSAARERELLTDLARRRNVEDVSPVRPTFPEVMSLLTQEGLNLLHFVGHGEFSRENPEDSRIRLADARFLVAGEMDGPLLRNIASARPLVYFNACSTAQQGAALTSLSGWPDAWVSRGGAGAFIAPQWQVRDSLAFDFARIFYRALERGLTLGRAARLARLVVRRKDRKNVTWLAFAVYGHPNAQVSFGSKLERPLRPPVRPERAAPGGDRPAPEIFGGTRTGGYSAPTAITSRLPLPPPSFLGRDDDVRFLKTRLCQSQAASADRGPLLLMIGWPGVGKTTMTTALANDPELYEAFPDGILWTSLDQSPNVLIELSSWCIALGSPGPSPGATVEEASLQLGHLLRNRRVLLLLDDVWETVHATPFLVGGPGCGMLATSRLAQVAEQLAPTSGAVYRLPLLTEEAGLELLRSRAPEVVAAYAEECQVLVRELEGLPLSLHVAGRMLAQESRLWSPAELLETLRAGRKLLEEKAPSDRTDLSTQTLPTLSVLLAKSTERLPPELLERFAFLGVFAPKPATFDLAALRAVWDVEDPKPSVRALVNLGLLEPAGEGRFRMHALLIAHAESLLEE